MINGHKEWNWRANALPPNRVIGQIKPTCVTTIPCKLLLRVVFVPWWVYSLFLTKYVLQLQKKNILLNILSALQVAGCTCSWTVTGYWGIALVNMIWPDVTDILTITNVSHMVYGPLFSIIKGVLFEWPTQNVPLLYSSNKNSDLLLMVMHSNVKSVSLPWRHYALDALWCDQGFHISRASCQKGPICHAYAWQVGPFLQDTLDMS